MRISSAAGFTTGTEPSSPVSLEDLTASSGVSDMVTGGGTARVELDGTSNSFKASCPNNSSSFLMAYAQRISSSADCLSEWATAGRLVASLSSRSA